MILLFYDSTPVPGAPPPQLKLPATRTCHVNPIQPHTGGPSLRQRRKFKSVNQKTSKGILMSRCYSIIIKHDSAAIGYMLKYIDIKAWRLVWNWDNEMHEQKQFLFSGLHLSYRNNREQKISRIYMVIYWYQLSNMAHNWNHWYSSSSHCSLCSPWLQRRLKP